MVAKEKAGKTNTSIIKNWWFWLIMVFVLVSAAAIVVVLLAFSQKPEISSSALIKRYAEESSYIKSIIESDDPDGLSGNEFEYETKSSWEDSRISDIVEDHAGTVEVFRNEKDAELREWYLDLVAEKCLDFISPDKYGKDLYDQSCGAIGYGVTYRNKTVIVRLSRSFSEEQVSEYKSTFNKLISEFSIVDNGETTSEKIDEQKKQREDKVASLFKQQEEVLKGELDTLSNTLDKTLNDLLNSLDETKLEEVRNDYSNIATIPYFSEKSNVWADKILDISEKIKSKKAADEQAKKAAKTRTFSAGKYAVGKHIDSGTYNVTAISGSGNFFLRNSSGISTINEMMSSSGGRYYLTSYSNAALISGYEIEIKGNLVLKFEAVD